MPVSRRSDGVLELGGVSLVGLADGARETPTYVYDLDGMAAEAREIGAAFEGAPNLVAYAVKANSAGPIVRALGGEGCGADVVSGAELMLALACGISPDRIVYSGVGKSDGELDQAIIAGPDGILAIQIESVEEIARVAARARAASCVARISLRINPGVDEETLDTHSYIATGHDEAKFGVPLACVSDALERVKQETSLRLVGLTSHVGSQFTTVDPYLEAARVLFDLTKSVRARFALSFVDTGGGFGIDYGEGCTTRPADFVRATRRLQKKAGLDDLLLACEPGRSLVASHGVLLARVLQRKVGDAGRRWILIDAGMNDLMRPALYQARHRVVPLATPKTGASAPFRVVGPVCESSDDFGVHELPEEDVAAVALLDAGAYGYSMASRYNGRALPGEVFLRGGNVVGNTARKGPDDWVLDRLHAGNG